MGLSTEVGRQEGRPGEVFWKPRGCLHVVTPPPRQLSRTPFELQHRAFC